MTLTRRHFLAGAAGAAAATAATTSGLVGCSRDDEPDGDDGWGRGTLAHLLPAVSHRSIVVKASFAAPPPAEPVLRVGEARVPGVRSDARGRFGAFFTRTGPHAFAPQPHYRVRGGHRG